MIKIEKQKNELTWLGLAIKNVAKCTKHGEFESFQGTVGQDIYTYFFINHTKMLVSQK